MNEDFKNRIDLKNSKLLNSKKGKQYYKKRTICEVIRELCDHCVIKFHEDPESMEEILYFLEEIFIMATRMNKKLIKYKLDTDTLFESNTKSKEEVLKIRKERTRLIRIMEENNNILKDGY